MDRARKETWLRGHKGDAGNLERPALDSIKGTFIHVHPTICVIHIYL